MHTRVHAATHHWQRSRCKTTANRIKTRSPAETRPWLRSAVDVSLSVRSRIGVAVISTGAITRRCVEELPLPPSARSHSPAIRSPDASSITGQRRAMSCRRYRIRKSAKTLNRIIRFDLAGSARGGSRLFGRNGRPFGADQPERLSPEIREIAFLQCQFVLLKPSAQRRGKSNGEVAWEDSRALSRTASMLGIEREPSRDQRSRGSVYAHIYARVSNRESLLGTRRDEFRVDERGGAHGPLIRRFARTFKCTFLSRWIAKGETGRYARFCRPRQPRRITIASSFR